MSFKFLHENVVKQVEENNLKLAIAQINRLYPIQTNWLSKLLRREKFYKRKGEFAYLNIGNMIQGNQPVPKDEFQKLNFKEDYYYEVIELCQFLLRIENKVECVKLEEQLSKFLKSLHEDLSVYIQDNSKGYPNNSISGKIWMDGAIIREWCQELANYFGRKKDIKSEIDLCFFKGKVTMSIMGHYPEEVGPDMISIASKLEDKKDLKNAANFYRPVVSDFQDFLESMESDVDEDEFEVEQREEIILNSLIKAVEGISRIEGYVDSQNLIQRSKKMLKKKTS